MEREDSPEGDRQRQDRIWGSPSPVVGMVHLEPLPGSPGYSGSMGKVLDRALEDATLLLEGGVHGILVENFGDAPFFPDAVPPETVAAMAVVVREVVRLSPLPVGVNVLRNDASAALAVAVGAGGRFIRVNVHAGSMYSDQGLLQGGAHLTLRRRAALGEPILILADVFVKHATPPPGLTLEEAAEDTWSRGGADGLVLTGTRTGAPVDSHRLEALRRCLPEGARLWAGSGARPETARALLGAFDGIIVGSALQKGGVAGGGVDPGRVRQFMAALAED